MRPLLGSITLLIVFIPISLLLGGMAVWYYVGYTGEPPLTVPIIFWQTGTSLEKMFLVRFSLAIYALFSFFTIGILIKYYLKQRKMVYGRARLANALEIKKAGLFANEGLFFGYHKGKPLFDNSQLHILLIADSGTGKGVSLIVPNLFLWSGSVICTDMKRENFNYTSGYRASRGQSVYAFDPFRNNTHRINPLHYIDENNPIDHLQKISYIIWPDNEKGEKIWAASARTLFLGLGLLVYLEEGKDAVSFSKIISTNATIDYKDIDARISKLKGPQSIIDRCWQILKQHSETPDKTRGGFEAEFRSGLDIFMNPTVAWATSGNDVPLDRMRKDPITLYLCTSPSDVNRVSFIMRMILETVNMLHTQEEFKANPEHKYHLLMLNDEQHNFYGGLPLMMKAASFYRSYGIRIFSVYQSRAQIDIDYGKDGAIAYVDNHHIRIFYCPTKEEKAKEISAAIGETTVFTKSKSRGGSGTSTNESPQKREAFLPEEIIDMLGQTHGFLFVSGTRPIKFKKAIWYKQKEFTARQLEPVTLPSVSTATIEEFLSEGNTSFKNRKEQEKDPIKKLAQAVKDEANDDELNSIIDGMIIAGDTA